MYRKMEKERKGREGGKGGAIKTKTSVNNNGSFPFARVVRRNRNVEVDRITTTTTTTTPLTCLTLTPSPCLSVTRHLVKSNHTFIFTLLFSFLVQTPSFFLSSLSLIIFLSSIEASNVGYKIRMCSSKEKKREN